MTARLLLALFLALLSTAPQAASSAQTLTPLNTSVLGGEERTYSVRFFDAFGNPSVGETVTFFNDACGFFQNGLINVSVLTDTSGVASATFRARLQGITCWITVTAGVSVRFNVFTYTAGQVYIDGHASPSEALPGDGFTFTAGVFQGAYPIYEADISARVIPGSISATITPGTGNMGQSRRGVDFEVQPQDRIGDFAIEVTHRGLTRRFDFQPPANPLQDMWWGGAIENGWGMSVVQHGDMLFSVVYAYDDAGKPIWYVMPGGAWNEAKTAFTGALYVPTGTPYTAYDASKLVVNDPVGSATLTFTSARKAVLDYTINGITSRKNITRQLFGPAEDGAPLKGLGDMWWGGAQQNGWGIALLQQYKSLFGVWFTYDAAGAPTWFVMPLGRWATLDSYEGRIYRTTGSPWLGKAYDANLLKPVDVGTFRFRFAGDTAAFEYTIDGKPGAIPLVRQGF